MPDNNSHMALYRAAVLHAHLEAVRDVMLRCKSMLRRVLDERHEDSDLVSQAARLMDVYMGAAMEAIAADKKYWPN